MYTLDKKCPNNRSNYSFKGHSNFTYNLFYNNAVDIITVGLLEYIIGCIYISFITVYKFSTATVIW